MYTYQDLLKIPEDNEQARMDFVRGVISQHKASEPYKMAVTGKQYNAKRNTSIMDYQKTLRTIDGRSVVDKWSPNHKTTRNFFAYFTTQQNQYLLGNGVTWGEDSTAEKLGADFDTQLQRAGKMALVQGESFGFFNLDHLEVFGLVEFAPLYDEENGALRAGVRFWQVDSTRPLRATFYEEDGYTNYIWNERADVAKEEKGGRILKEKTPYILKVRTSEADGTEIYDGENYPTFPIVPLWANEEKQSELVGIQEQIDAYDLIKNGFLNDLDTAQIYWILKGAGGMDDTDLVRFLDRIHMNKMASLDDDQSAEATTVQIPYEARERLLDRIEADIYKDYMALNIDEIKGGAVTATQIEAAYEPLNAKADQYEYQIIQFISGILEVAGIDDEPSFTRSKLINVNESVSTVLMASEALSSDYVTEKIFPLLGDGDQAEDVIENMEADELEMGGLLEDEEEDLLGEEIEEEETESTSEMEEVLSMLENMLKEI
jgi:SPP1 family phage portal protein